MVAAVLLILHLCALADADDCHDMTLVIPEMTVSQCQLFGQVVAMQQVENIPGFHVAGYACRLPPPAGDRPA